ncbi:tetratricopeptide repeat protein [Maridesulfovibrio sp.]|uniref:tetratricopeptide repeat protein n=1 Tax=Maridesulfovibrio sp. TaxID=2795000 RepID=UPI002A18D3ED|nr:tetratricopeptide repeat protein [Maridesulfovibrio sp.]
MFNSTQILDAAMAVPGVVWGWFWGLGFTVKLSVLGVVLAAYPVSVHFFGLFKRKGNDRLTQSVEVNVNVPERVDSQTLAEKVYEDQRKDLRKAQQTIQSKDEVIQSRDDEIKALKDVIDGLREPQDTQKETDYAAQAEAELAKGNTDLAKAFFNAEAAKNVDGSDELRLKAAQAYRRAGLLDFMNNPKEAVKAYQKSVELDPNSAEGWNRLGQLRYLFGELEESKAAFINISCMESNNLVWTAIAHGNLGVIHKNLGDFESAENCYNKALKIYEQLGNTKKIATVLGNLGSLCYACGDIDGAESFNMESLAKEEKKFNHRGLAIRYGNLGVVKMQKGYLLEAEELYCKALEIDKDIEYIEGIACDYGNLGILRELQGNLKEANEYWQKSLDLFKQIGAAPMIEKVQFLLDRLEAKINK